MESGAEDTGFMVEVWGTGRDRGQEVSFSSRGFNTYSPVAVAFNHRNHLL